MRNSFLFKLIALLLAFGLIAAACGDDDDDTAAGDDSAASDDGGDGTASDDGGDDAASDDAASDDAAPAGDCDDSDLGPIKLGIVAQLQFYAGIEDGVRARIERANAEGGICGRMLEFAQAIDDNSDPQQNLDGARTLVEQDGVYGVITTSAVLLPQTSDYLAEQQVPFSGWGFMPGFCLPNEWGFGFSGCVSGWGFGIEGAEASLAVSDPVNDLVGKDDWTLVLFNSDDTAGESGSKLYNFIWGDRIVGEEFVPVGGTITDTASYVNLVLDNEPDAVILSTDFAGALALKAAIIAAGYEGPVIDYTTYVPGLLQSSPETAAALEGGYSNTQIPPFEDGAPATQQIADDLEAAGLTPFVTMGASIGYWGTDTLIQIIEAAAATGSTEKDAFNQVANVDGVDISFPEGGLCPWNTLEAHTQVAPGAAIVKVENGEYTSAVPFGCWSRLPAE